MNNDQTTRSARRVATAVAVPLALVTGFVMFQALKPAPEPVPSPTAQATASATVLPVIAAPVHLEAVQLNERQALVCRAFLSKLPEQLRGLPRRQVTGGHEQNAAFGEPAVTVACGVPAPTFAPTDFVYPLSGVCWHPNEAGSVWTAVDREVTIALTLPAALSGQASGQWAAALSATVAASVLSAEVKPSGCA